MYGDRFEIFTEDSGIHEHVDLVLCLKNIFQLEVIISARGHILAFLNM